jgi:putative resolvase
VNLNEWTHAQGIRVTAAYCWYREGVLPVPAQKAGRLILVSPDTAADPSPQGGAGLYARVSCHDQRADLHRHAARRPAWAVQADVALVRAGAEAGSGMNGAEARARRLLAGPAATVVVVEHRDRLGRVNTELVEGLVAAHHRRLVVLGSSKVTGGMIEVLRSFCAGLYGRRPPRNRALKAVGCAQRGVGPQAVLTAGSSRCGGGAG